MDFLGCVEKIFQMGREFRYRLQRPQQGRDKPEELGLT